MSSRQATRTPVLPIVLLALALVVAAVPALNVALPSLTASTGASMSQLQWVVDAYALVFAGLLLPAGALGDRYGRKPVLVVGLIVFSAGAGLSALSSSPQALIGLRGLMAGSAAVRRRVHRPVIPALAAAVVALAAKTAISTSLAVSARLRSSKSRALVEAAAESAVATPTTAKSTWRSDTTAAATPEVLMTRASAGEAPVAAGTVRASTASARPATPWMSKDCTTIRGALVGVVAVDLVGRRGGDGCGRREHEPGDPRGDVDRAGHGDPAAPAVAPERRGGDLAERSCGGVVAGVGAVGGDVHRDSWWLGGAVDSTDSPPDTGSWLASDCVQPVRDASATNREL